MRDTGHPHQHYPAMSCAIGATVAEPLTAEPQPDLPIFSQRDAYFIRAISIRQCLKVKFMQHYE